MLKVFCFWKLGQWNSLQEQREKYTESHSTLKIPVCLIQNPYLGKWPLCLRHCLMFRHNCTQIPYFRISRLPLQGQHFQLFFFFYMRWSMPPCVCGKTHWLLPAEAGGVLPPAMSLFGMNSVVINHPTSLPLQTGWEPPGHSPNVPPDSAHLCSSQKHPLQ